MILNVKRRVGAKYFLFRKHITDTMNKIQNRIKCRSWIVMGEHQLNTGMFKEIEKRFF